MRPFYGGRRHENPSTREVPKSGGRRDDATAGSIVFFQRGFFQYRGSSEEPRHAAPGAFFCSRGIRARCNEKWKY